MKQIKRLWDIVSDFNNPCFIVVWNCLENFGNHTVTCLDFNSSINWFFNTFLSGLSGQKKKAVTEWSVAVASNWHKNCGQIKGNHHTRFVTLVATHICAKSLVTLNMPANHYEHMKGSWSHQSHVNQICNCQYYYVIQIAWYFGCFHQTCRPTWCRNESTVELRLSERLLSETLIIRTRL